MGYALMFARALSNTAKKNQINYETMYLQNRKENITKQLAGIQQLESSMVEAAKQKGEEAPDVSYLQMYREMLTLMSNNLDTRLKYLQTQLTAVSAEENSINEALNAQISASTPKYAGR